MKDIQVKRRMMEMTTLKRKTMAFLIALFLMLTIAVPLIALPTVNAAVNYYHSYVYAIPAPYTLGVGQQMLLVAWTADMPQDIGETAGTVNSPTGRAGWYGIQINITHPDGETEIVDTPYSDSAGSTWLAYVPTKVGEYKIQAIFPETWKNATANQYWYSSAVSEILSFTVQEEPLPPWNESPIPNDYWTRPIYGASRNWYALAGNWLSGAANVWPVGGAGGTTTLFGYSQGPESAHIMWTKPLWAGGIMDARIGSITYTPEHYGGITFVPVIIQGKIYYPAQYSSDMRQGHYCVDLYTGETLYLKNATMPSFGQIYLYDSPNQHGGFPYIWRTSGIELPEIVQVPRATLANDVRQMPVRVASVQTINRTATPISTGNLREILDAQTGNTLYYIANVSTTGTNVYGQDGSILYYNAANLGTTAEPKYYLTVWNSSHGTVVASQTGSGLWQWRPQGGNFGASNAYLGGLATNYVHDGSVFYSLNVSIPSLYGPRNTIINQTASIQAVRQDKYVIFGTAGRNDERGLASGWMMAVSLEPGKEGTKLWESTFTPPFASQAGNVSVSLTGVYPEDEVILFWSAKLVKRWAYDLKTGQLLWESKPENPMNYHMYTVTNVYQGKLITTGTSGEVLAYNVTTGEIVWKYQADFDFLSESPYGHSPLVISCIADGKIYTGHTFWGVNPGWRDYIRCINASNGEELWRILYLGRTGGTAGQLYVADGFVVGLNYFDNQIYCFGRGPSATTVTASPEASVHGSSVLVKGTVTDQSQSGRRTTNDRIDFTLKGTPAISEEDMGKWMEYLFMQQAYPEDAKGVEVVLEVLDPNNNLYEIGRTTSDITGTYGYAFEPQVPGTYQIMATFKGSASYGPSFATTYIHVDEAPEPDPTPTSQPATIADMYLVPGVIGIIITIIVVGILIMLMLRKR
jgi:hypothetical protein